MYIVTEGEAFLQCCVYVLFAGDSEEGGSNWEHTQWEQGAGRGRGSAGRGRGEGGREGGMEGAREGGREGGRKGWRRRGEILEPLSLLCFIKC